MTTYKVVGDAYRGDSPSIEREEPPFFDSAEDTAEFAPEGFSVDVNYVSGEMEILGGYVRLYDGSEPWHVFFDGRVSVDLESDTGITYIYAAYDTSQGELYYEAKSTESSPSNPSLLISEVDAGSQKHTPRNRDPERSTGAMSFKDNTGTTKRTIKYDSQLGTMVVIDR